MSKREQMSGQKTINQLLGWQDGEPPFETPLAEKCETALATPIDELSIGQLRLLISQNLGTELLIDRVADILEENPMTAATFFAGDLLMACLRLPTDVWQGHPDAWHRVHAAFESVQASARDLLEFVDKARQESRDFYAFAGVTS